MEAREIKCDECGSDLTYTGNCEDYYLVLANASKGSRGGFVTAMAISPPIDRTHHFCGLNCLDRWRDRERHYSKLRRERSAAWEAEHGTVHPGGMMSYPCPPRETLAVWNEECRAAALAEFPIQAA